MPFAPPVYKLLLVKEYDLQPHSDADIGAQKMHILEEWGRLPEEQRVRVAAVMLCRLLESDLFSAVSRVAEEVQPLLTPEALRKASLAEKDIAVLSDEDLVSIVEGIVNHFVQDAIWDKLEFATRKLLLERQEQRTSAR